MKTATKILILTALVAVAATAAVAQPGAGRGGRDGDFFGPRMMKALDLTEEQTAEIEALFEDHREATADTRKELMRLRHDKKGLMLQDDPKLSDAESLVRSMSELRTELQLERTKLHFAVRERLTDEQLDKMMMMKARRGDGPRKGRGGRRDGGDRPRVGICDGDGPYGRGRN